MCCCLQQMVPAVVGEKKMDYMDAAVIWMAFPMFLSLVSSGHVPVSYSQLSKTLEVFSSGKKKTPYEFSSSVLHSTYLKPV